MGRYGALSGPIGRGRLRASSSGCSSGPAKVKPLHVACALQYCFASSTSIVSMKTFSASVMYLAVAGLLSSWPPWRILRGGGRGGGELLCRGRGTAPAMQEQAQAAAVRGAGTAARGRTP